MRGIVSLKITSCVHDNVQKVGSPISNAVQLMHKTHVVSEVCIPCQIRREAKGLHPKPQKLLEAAMSSMKEDVVMVFRGGGCFRSMPTSAAEGLEPWGSWVHRWRQLVMEFRRGGLGCLQACRAELSQVWKLW